MTANEAGDRSTVSNPKLVDMTPTWRPYRGWTVLHRPHASAVGRTLYDIADESEPNRDFYSSLAEWFGALPLGHLGDPVAQLPLSTLHVTICDGLSPMHLGRISGRRRRKVESMLATLPDTVDDLEGLTMGNPVLLRRLLDAAAEPVRYSLAGVAGRGTAVVAELSVDERDLAFHAEVVARRDELLDALGKAVAADLTSSWRPHVTLAYAPNRDVNRSVAATVAASSHELVDAMSGRVLSLAGSAVYAFDDMVTFWQGAIGVA